VPDRPPPTPDTAGDATPRCRVCGRALEPNRRGDYVDCCSRLVPPPQSHREARSVLGWWGRLIDGAVTRLGEFASVVPASSLVHALLGAALMAVAIVVLFYIL